MISNQILQDTVTGIKSITRVELCVMDTEGKILATTMRGMEEYEDEVVKFSESAADSQVIRGFQFFKVYDENELEYVILARGCRGCLYDWKDGNFPDPESSGGIQGAF